MTRFRQYIEASKDRRERGASSVEYAMIAAVIVIPLSIGMGILRDESEGVIVEGGRRSGTPAEYSEGVVVPP